MITIIVGERDFVREGWEVRRVERWSRRWRSVIKRLVVNQANRWC